MPTSSSSINTSAREVGADHTHCGMDSPQSCVSAGVSEPWIWAELCCAACRALLFDYVRLCTYVIPRKCIVTHKQTNVTFISFFKGGFSINHRV